MNVDTAPIRRLRDHLLEPLVSSSPAASAPSQQVLLRRLEPIAEIMYLVMMADGYPAPPEKRVLHAALMMLSGGHLSDGEATAVLDRCDLQARAEGAEARLRHIGARMSADPGDRELAFVLAAVAALADDQVVATEDRVLGLAKDVLGLSDRRAAEILGQLS